MARPLLPKRQPAHRPHLPERTFREDMDQVPGLYASQRRLTKHYGDLYAAVQSLESPLDVDALLDYMEEPLKRAGITPGSDEYEYGTAISVLLGAVLLAIEADREGRS